MGTVKEERLTFLPKFEIYFRNRKEVCEKNVKLLATLRKKHYNVESIVGFSNGLKNKK